MTLGRTTSGAIKIKTDESGGGLRAVNCACCGPIGFFYEFQNDACPSLSYWYAQVDVTTLADGSKQYLAEFSSAVTFGLWHKIGAPSDPIDFEGLYTNDYGNQGDITITLESSSPDCDGVAKLNFNHSDYYADCDFNTIPAAIFACKI